MLITALAILCSLAVAAASTCVAGWRDALGFAVGFLSLAMLPASWLEPGAVALLAAATGAHGFWRPQSRSLSALLGGAAGWCWCAVLAAQGLPLAMAVPMPIALAAAGAWLTWRRPGFAPDWLRDEAQLVVVALGLVVATGPVIADGYATAVALRAMPLGESSHAAPEAALLIAAAMVGVGCIHAAWRRR